MHSVSANGKAKMSMTREESASSNCTRAGLELRGCTPRAACGRQGKPVLITWPSAPLVPWV
eukprot:1533950-Prorocentrum_lima.AAC.1